MNGSDPRFGEAAFIFALLLSFSTSAAPAPVAVTPPPNPPAAEASPAGLAQSNAAEKALQTQQSSSDEIPLVGGDPPAIKTPSAPDAWGGERPPNSAELSQRVADYDLEAVLDPKAHTVEGKETLRWKNRSAVPVRSLYFHLYLNAFEGPHSTWMTERGKGQFRSVNTGVKKGEWGYIDVLEITAGGAPVKQSFVHPDGGAETDHTVLRVELAQAVAPGAVVEVKMRFHDQLPRVVARTGYFDSFHLVGQWFPKIGVLELPGERGAVAPRWNVHEFHLFTEFYADFGNYNLQVTAPKGFTVAATGTRVGEPRETPEGVVHQFHQDDIHDAVFTAWDKYAAPLHGTYEGIGSPKVGVDVYFPSGDEASAGVVLQSTLDSLKYFSDTLGPYPYSHVTALIPPVNADEAGGMEYETFFTTEGGNGLAGTLTYYVTVHEFGHSYFMGLLASNEFEEPMLDEGMNEFWDVRMLGDTPVKFGGSFFGAMRELGFPSPPVNFQQAERGLGGTPRFAPDPLAAKAWDYYGPDSFPSVYARTATLMHDLEAQLGGEVLLHGMKLYYQRWHHRHPSIADLRAALVDGSDTPEQKQLVMSWFDGQVYAARPVDDELTEVVSEELAPEPGMEIKEGKRIELEPEAVEKQIRELREAFEKSHTGESVAGGKSDATPKKPASAEAAKVGTATDFKPGPFSFRSKVKAERRGFQVAQTLLVKFEDGRTQSILWPPGEVWHRWVFEGPARIESAQLDPERKVLLDVDKFDDGRMREPSGSVGRRWTLELASWTEVFFSLVGGL